MKKITKLALTASAALAAAGSMTGLFGGDTAIGNVNRKKALGKRKKKKNIAKKSKRNNRK